MATLSNKRIIIIDDMKDVRTLVRQILEADGATVFEASTVDAGMEMTAEKIPHLIISDLSMPDKTGFDLLKMIRVNPLLNRIPVLVLSGLNDKDSVTEAVALGANDYLLKPLKASNLLQKVRKGLNSSKFLSFKFPPKEQPKATVTLNAELVSMSEVSMKIESSVKLVANKTISLSGDFLNEIGCDDTVIRTSRNAGSLQSKGRYLSELIFVGLSSEIANSLRSRLRRLK